MVCITRYNSDSALPLYFTAPGDQFPAFASAHCPLIVQEATLKRLIYPPIPCPRTHVRTLILALVADVTQTHGEVPFTHHHKLYSRPDFPLHGLYVRYLHLLIRAPRQGF